MEEKIFLARVAE